MLYQLSYVPSLDEREMVGVSGLEPETSALSGQCSNQLSYAPRAPAAGRLHRLTLEEW